MPHTLHPETLAIRGAKEQTEYNEHHQALFLSSSFMFDTAAEGAALFSGQQTGYTYSRTGNPTVTAFSRRIAQLEGGEEAVATATGMAAVQAGLLPFLSAGGHLIASRSLSQQAASAVDEGLQDGAWKVQLTPGQELIWRAPPGSDRQDEHSEPDASLSLRLMLKLIGPLAPDSLL